MIAKLRDAKGRLSELVQLAAAGEEIVITVRGEPKARLTAVTVAPAPGTNRAEWAAELGAAAEADRSGTAKSTPQNVWDDLREERL